MNTATEYNNALLIIENNNIGWASIQQIIDRGYDNLFYTSKDLKYVDVEHQLSNKIYREERNMVPGFSMTMKTRPLVVAKIEEYFRGVATKSNTEEQTKDIKNQLSDNKNRILYVIPENEFDVFISTSLFESIKELYPKHDLYVATNDAHCSLLYANDHVHKVLSLNEQFNNLENFKDDEGNDLFETIYTPSLNKSNYQQITKTNICYK